MAIAAINTSASGDTTLVAATAGKKIKVKRAVVINQVATANAVKFRGATSDLHSAIPLPLAVGQGITIDNLVGTDLQTVAGHCWRSTSAPRPLSPAT